ncbi:putative ankycorbin-like [Cocos nucifera]|uniref:Putative ankycorbin-like n=1 Tax=Cocos nucifera TaxID=13894 RepID=A0A8K0HW37_COCNU|nr:putative ankycorbin-like [Cocos nucifera]
MTMGPSRTAAAGMGLHDSILKNYRLASEAFSNILHPIDATKLLIELLKIRRPKVMDYFLWLAHYLNGFMEHTFKRSSEVMRYRPKDEMLKVAEDRASEGAKEASIEAEVAEKRS